MLYDRLISADSHFVEPPEMWAERIDPEYKDRAPHVVRDVGGRKGQFIVCEGMAPSAVGRAFGAGVRPEDLPRLLEEGFDGAPDYVRDPTARLEAQDQDGVVAEVLYATYGLDLFALEDDGLRNACFRAYNDWVADYCNVHPDRLIGVALIALDDIDEGVRELRRVVDLGFQGAMIWTEPPADRPYSHPDYDPFWDVAQECDVKLSLHSLTSRRADAAKRRADVVYEGFIIYQEIGRTLADFILHGVLERYPRLRIISAENEIGWMPFHLWRMDMLHEKLHHAAPTKLSLKPSEYFERQVFATFIEDTFLDSTIKHINHRNILWSNDFPHVASTWPESRKFIETELRAVSEDALEDVLHNNTAKLYNIKA